MYPPIDFGRIVPLTGGLRLMFLRWLFVFDPLYREAYYQPLLWIEYAKEGKGFLGQVNGRHLLIQVTIPPERGRAFLAIPLSPQAYRDMGNRFFIAAWESWSEEASPDDGLDDD